MNSASSFVSLISVILLLNLSSLQAQGDEASLEQALEFAETQLVATVAEIADSTRYPAYAATGGYWVTTTCEIWTSGFFPGSLWYMYESTSEQTWLDWAKKWKKGKVWNKMTNTVCQ